MGELRDYVSVRTAAVELGVTKARVEQYVRAGRLAAEMFEGRLVIRRDELARFKAAPKMKRGPKPKGPPPAPAPPDA